MNIDFKKSFLKDIKNLKNENLRKVILNCIVQVEASTSISQIKNLKKLSNSDNCFRIRIGDYRIGLKLEKETLTFVVFGHRKEFYNEFPK
ncbi:MAG: type II toxin-antitoxin system RelE/ParE family toxin [Bacteroidetes bacterium]|nr:type II toxin-antitoxin system RelE/ParE family toxin [Bacteroidota bacterium]